MKLWDFLGSFSDRGKLFIVVFAISIIAIMFSLAIGIWWSTALLIIPAIVAILHVTKGVWTPEGGPKSNIGLASLGVALAVVASGQLWKPIVNSLLAPLYQYLPFLKGHLPSEAPSVAALIFMGVVIFIVNYFARDTTAMKQHSTAIEKEFPEKNYKQRLESFARVLGTDLHRIDVETNWSPELFAPLQAQVEVRSGLKRLRRVTDLLNAIRSDRRSRVFMVLGDPGSGKSVALRKLCRELLTEVNKTGKIPLYVNLREWKPAEPWSYENPPTVESLYEFVLHSLKSRGDVFANDFLDKYFKKMFENGRLFIVLDSFDEIPSVLDVDEGSWLIDSLSDVTYRFLAGAHESRGILASRVFRRPTRKFDAKTILEILPLTDRKIADLLKKSPFYDESLVTELFTRRPELVSLARNPFTAALIYGYARDHDNSLPERQTELYSSYITRRLDACQEKMRERNVTSEDVAKGATKIANLMFNTQTAGLDISIKDIESSMGDLPIAEIIDVLKYARLARIGEGDERRFSFVHRRFNEYFVVQQLMEGPDKVPMEAIPSDSRWRDALVLYCEVAGEDTATRIAEYCWSEVQKINQGTLDLMHPQYLRSIHCLRFLKEAFRARVSCVGSFRADLAKLVLEQMERKESLLGIKLIIESVGLLEEEDIEASLMKSFEINNQWIDETALKACNYLPNLSKELKRKIQLSIDDIDVFTYLRRSRDLLFSLKLNDIFADLRVFCILRTVDCWCLLAALILCTVASPVLVTTLLFFYASLLWSSEISKQFHRLVLFMFGKMGLWNLVTSTFARCLTAGVCIIGLGKLWGIAGPPAKVSVLSVGLGVSWLPLIGLCGFLLVPWYKAYYYLPPMFAGLKHVRWKDLYSRQTLVLGSFLLIMIGSAEALKRLPDTLPENAILFINFSFYGYIFTWLGLRLIWQAICRWRDFRYLQTVRARPSWTRQQISKDFYRLKTDAGRFHFAILLRDSKIKPEGSWPHGQIPSSGNDDGSTLIAQLEERWLGLER